MKKQNLQEIRSLVPGFLRRLFEFLAEGLGDGKTDFFLPGLFGFQRFFTGYGLQPGDGRLRQRRRAHPVRSFPEFFGGGCRVSDCLGGLFG